MGQRENGATLLKRRLLERVGWRVVSVRHWEWEAATRAGGAEGQRAYLEGLLRSPDPLLSGNQNLPHSTGTAAARTDSKAVQFLLVWTGGTLFE